MIDKRAALSRWLWAALVVGVVCFAGVEALRAEQPAAAERAVASRIPAPGGLAALEKAWSEGVELVRKGQFDQAGTTLGQTLASMSSSEKAGSWVRDWVEQERVRWELTRADYEKYAARARHHLEQDSAIKALEWTYRAMLSSVDPVAYRSQDWVQQIRALGLAKGDAEREKKEWLEAHHYYALLNVIFEDDKQIKRLREECLEYARLEEVYKKDRSKEWQEDLEGIDPSIVEEALWRIDEKYVVEADFRKMTVAAYEELLLLARSPALHEQIEGLAGERGRDFIARLEARLSQIKDEGELNYRGALKHFRRALQINEQTAKLPEALLVREYMSSALGELDEFSSMIWPADFAEFEKYTRGDFIGVGIQIRNKFNPELDKNEIVVVSPLEDTPAYRAGIQADDIITYVNGTSLLDVPVTRAVTMITGPQDTTVTLTIRRTGPDGTTQSTDYALKRARVSITSIKGVNRRTDNEQRWDFMLDRELGVAYVRLIGFQENTAQDLQVALSESAAAGMRGLILDLRFDPGGLLKSAVQTAELFLSKGDRIVSTKGLRSEEWARDAEVDGRYKDLPMIVLTTESSASASEIVAGAIKDHKRGLLIGERTFGKFSVQNLIQLARGPAHLKLTTGRYYLPSGRSLHREDGATTWGVEPDIAIALVPKEIERIRFMQRDMDVIGAVKTNSETEINEPRKPAEEDPEDKVATPEDEEAEKDPNTRPKRDPQLDTALLIMRTFLLRSEPAQVAEVPQPAGIPAAEPKRSQ